jgi:kynureninase
MAAHKASLDIFEEAGMENLIVKAKMLSGYLHFILNEINASCNIEVITPANEAEHGCQVSLLMHEKGKEVFEHLTKQGVVADWREPNVIRVAPVPLYNTFEEVWRFGRLLHDINV